MAAGTNAAGFAFVNSVKEFLGLPGTTAKVEPPKAAGEQKPVAVPAKDQESATSGETQQSGMIVGRSYHNDTSPPLRDMVQLPITPHELGEEREANKNPEIFNTHVDRPDPVVQSAMAPSAMPTPIQNFDGIPFPGVICNCAPPDTDGEVGSTQYVQMVNEGYQVFDKATGASVLGPSSINSLWAGFGGVCQSGSGDPIVLFDQIANRWLISQFAGSSIPTDECIAISQTADATGAYNRYAFHLGSNFFDYPHIGVWPDGYYMSDNVFNSAGSARLGTQAFVFDRAAMIAGLPATFITPGLTPGGNAEPYALAADLDGMELPPVGTPCPFVAWPSNGTYKTYLFHADFVTPANSTYTLRANPPAAAGFTQLCTGTRNCVPQLGSTGNLDEIGDRFMHRLPYRIIGGVERIVGNYTVSSGGVAGIRWVELRNVTSGTMTVFQESTYQPDTTWRWMGSAAQDTNGNMAIGFSASDATINPQVRYAGRLSTDPANTLAQGEATLFAGTGSQTGTGNRWGDYSALSIDPVDDCTFWYTQEYYATTSSFNWRTRIGSFKFPSCSQAPSFTLAVTPASQDICAGTSAMYTVNTTSIQGFMDPVILTATGIPAGTTATFSPNPVTPGSNSTLTIGNTAGVAAGSYMINVKGTSGAIMIDQDVTLNVSSASPGTSTLTAPANGATDQSLSPTFTWTAGTQATTYTLEIATDAGFANIVHTASGLTSPTYNGASLMPQVQYFWRVRGINTCGVGSNSAVFSFTTGLICNESFDGVTAPALPSGWTTTATGAESAWVTTTTGADTPPNSAFAPDPSAVGNTELISPLIAIAGGGGSFSFRNNYNTESTFDGMVLEISVNGGAYQDILAAGGSFVTGGYNATISVNFMSPIAGRMAWSGNSGGYLTTTVMLPAAANGNNIQLKWRMASDSSVASTGVNVDTITGLPCGPAGTPSPTATGSPSGTATATATSTATATATATSTGSPSPSPTCSPTNVINDGGFEAGGVPSTTWNDPQTSTNFGTPICDMATCGTGGGASPPRTGNIWAWFGGIGAPETATLGQTVVIPAGTAELHFWMRIGTVTTPFDDVLNVKVDNVTVQSYIEPAVAETDYTERVIDMTAFANGASHNITFEYIGTSTGTGSYVIDDVSLISGAGCATPTATATPTASPSGTPTSTATATATPTATPGACDENFDGVTAPALPSGWATTASGVESPWVTTTAMSSSPPNSAFAPDPNNVGDTELVSTPILISGGGGSFSFQNNYNTESTFDGMVLEISVNGGAYQDILAAGGSFVTGGYNATISVNFMSPIAGRMAWSGNSGGFITTTVNLPASANGQSIQLKWRMASDSSIAATGVWVDSISGLPCAGGTPSPTGTSTATSTATAIDRTPSPSPSCTPGGGAPGPWVAGTTSPPARYRAGGVSDGTFIYVFGGGDSVGAFLTDTWRMNAATGVWTQLANMPTGKQNIQGAYWNGKSYN